MIFDDFFDLPKEADIDNDGHISEREEADFLYAYDSMMGTNITGCFPENERKSDPDSIDRISCDGFDMNFGLHYDENEYDDDEEYEVDEYEDEEY